MLSRPLNRIATGLLCAFCAACGGSSDETTAVGAAAAAPPAAAPPAAVGAPPLPPSNVGQSPQVPAVPNSGTTPGSIFPLDPAEVAAAGGPFGQDPAGYTLTFLDNFDGALDRTIWNTQRHETINTVQNFATRNGILKIWPARDINGDFFFRTLDTEGRFAQRYGYFEIEAKLPKGQGVWPAFWLTNNAEGVNTAGSVFREIDVMEAFPSGEPPWSKTGPDGVPTAVMYAPVVWTGPETVAGSTKFPTPDLAADFHRYGVKWEPTRVTFYFDGKESFVVNATIPEPLFMILDLKYGSASGDPDNSTPTGETNSLEVSYIKVWQFR